MVFMLLYIIQIPMGTNCAPLLVDLLFYSYKVHFLQGLPNKFFFKEASPIPI